MSNATEAAAEMPQNEKNNVKSDSRWADGAGLPEIVTVGDPGLRHISDEYKVIAELRPLCDKLVSLLREFNGAGLAAPQIGHSEPVVVVEVRKTDLFPDRPTSPLHVMINPKVMETSGESVAEWEGCFSVPGIMAMVHRPERVRVQYQSPDGDSKDDWFEGYIGRVVMHEIDHLNGVLFTDLMDVTTLTTVENWKKFHLNKS